MGSASTHVVEVSDGEFVDSVVDRSRRVPVLAYVWAPWCGPCGTLGPMLERIADELAGAIVLAKIDVDANPALGEEFGVRGVPLLMLYRDGQCLTEVPGILAGPGGIRALLERHFAVTRHRDN